MKQFYGLIHDELWQAVDLYCYKNRISKGSFLLEALEKLLKEKQEGK